MVSAKKDDIDKIRGLGLGADDYITKPFSPSEMVARVKAHLARYERLIGSGMPENEIIEIRGLKIDKTARRVYINGEEKNFTTKEFDLLTFLAQNPNHVFTKKNSSARSGIWSRWEISRRLPCILRRSVRRSSSTRRNRSILRRYGVLDTGLKSDDWVSHIKNDPWETQTGALSKGRLYFIRNCVL